MIDPKPAVNPLYLSEEALFQGIDLLYFAYREYEREDEELLESRGLGRAHIRADDFPVGQSAMLCLC